MAGEVMAFAGLGLPAMAVSFTVKRALAHRATITLDQEAYEFMQAKAGKTRSAFINGLIQKERNADLAALLLAPNQRKPATWITSGDMVGGPGSHDRRRNAKAAAMRHRPMRLSQQGVQNAAHCAPLARAPLVVNVKRTKQNGLDQDRRWWTYPVSKIDQESWSTASWLRSSEA